MIHDDSLVERDQTPNIVWPDEIPKDDETGLILDDRRSWFYLLFVGIFTITLVIGIFIHLKAILGSHTIFPSKVHGLSAKITLNSHCSLDELWFKCKDDIKGLLPEIPTCVIDTYQEYRTEWIPFVDVNFVQDDTNICHTANKALVMVAYYAQEHIASDVQLENIYALALLYFSLRGENWVDESWFTSNIHLRNWMGISLDSAGHVQEIRLHQRFLEGILPSSVFSIFPSLKHIDLSSNLIRGPLPKSLGKTLESLELDNNFLTGTIPLSWTKSTTIKYIQMEYNQLVGTLPSELSDMTQLEILSLASNSLESHIPSDIANCTSLKALDISRNKFDGAIPPQLGNLSQLQYLDLSENSFADGTLPINILLLTNLSTLILSQCSLTGSISNKIGNLSKLSYLSLGSNSFRGSIPTEIGKLSKLESLELEFNGINGTLPSEFGLLRQLKLLDLRFNDLTGSLPTEFGRLLQLETFLLASNMLQGEIPKEICNLWDDGVMTAFGDVFHSAPCEDSSFGGATCPSEECCQDCSGSS
jgi:Leucine rich repeat